MKLLVTLLTLLAAATLQSCSYCYAKYKTEGGKNVWIKEYKDYEVAERKRAQSSFKRLYVKQEYHKYGGNITSDTVHGITYVQYDSIRVFLFSEAVRFKEIFTSGLLSGPMINCVTDSLCRPTPDINIVDAETGEPIVQKFHGWTGPAIMIEHFELLEGVNAKGNQRRFKFWVFPHKHRFVNGNTVFLLELTNDSADRNTDLITFIKGARVTFIKNAWGII